MSESDKQLRSSIESMFTVLKERLDGLFGRTDTHFGRVDNPHGVTKVQVGLSEIPNAVTSARNVNSVGQLLTAKGIYDHTLSGDHDARYYTQTQLDQALGLKIDIATIVNDLTSNTADAPLSAAQGKVLKDAVDAINALINSDDGTLDEIQEIVDFIKVNRDTLENLTIASIAGLGSALAGKVDKVTGKGLSENDLTDALLSKLNGIAAGADVNVPSNLTFDRTATEYVILNSNGTGVTLAVVTASDAGLMSPSLLGKLNGIETDAEVNPETTAARNNSSTTVVLQAKALRDHALSGDHDARYYTQTQLDATLDTKVDKVSGKGLSSEDYTTAEKSKLSGVQAGAQANVATNLSLGGSGNNRTLQSSTGANVGLPPASTSTAGLMTTQQFDKLVGMEAGAQVNVATNLDRTLSTTSITITNTNGSNAVLPGATTNTAGLLSSTDKIKLNSVAAGAEVNVGTDLSLTGTGNSRALQSSTGGNVAVPISTSTNAGFMGIGDRTKLDGIGEGAQANVATNLGVTRASTDVTVSSSTGGDVTLGSATVSLAGVMTADDKSKLNGVSAGAQVNVGTDLSYSTAVSSVTLISSTGDSVEVPAATVDAAGAMSAADRTKLDGIDSGAETNPESTAARNDQSMVKTLQAKAMYDHVAAGDHDASYVTKAGNSTVVGEITANDFIYASDESLKDAIEHVSEISDRYRQLLPRRYVLKDDPDKKIRFGFLAHEAAGVFPELLRTREDGKLSLAYVDFIALLTQSFKEKCVELDEVRSEVASMRGEIDELVQVLRTRQ